MEKLDAIVFVDSYAGRREFPCRVIEGSTPRMWRIEVDVDTKLPSGVLHPGESVLVPKHAVRFLAEREK